MNVELISVGTELLLGDIINTNANYLSKECANMGFSLYYQVTVGDNYKRFCETLKASIKRADIIILTGGLGPTSDDITKEVVAESLGREIIQDEHSRDRLISYFKLRKGNDENKENLNKWGFTDNNWKQALKIEGSIVIDNNNGTAPGYIVEDDQAIIILLPGPPREMKAMFEESISPYLKRFQEQVFHSDIIKLCGIGESTVETELMDIIESQTNPTIATYGVGGEIHIRLTASGKTVDQAKTLIEPLITEIQKRLPSYVYSVNIKDNLETVVVDLLKEKNLTIATAESCTGGLLSGRIISVAGASAIFNEGFITYSNESKVKYLNVSKESLTRHGAVSSEVAREMAMGLASETGADIAVAITGNAGPDSSSSKAVGLVYITCVYKGDIIEKEVMINGDRNKIRNYTSTYALNLIRKVILHLI